MTCKEGKNVLRKCLKQVDSSLDIDELFYYKYGNRKHAKDYQKNDVVTSFTEKDMKQITNSVQFVVTCYIHFEVYVAWHKSIGQGNGKYVVYRRDLAEMENDPDCDYKEIDIGKTEDAKAYIFRGESGIKKFIQKNVISK